MCRCHVVINLNSIAGTKTKFLFTIQARLWSNTFHCCHCFLADTFFTKSLLEGNEIIQKRAKNCIASSGFKENFYNQLLLSWCFKLEGNDCEVVGLNINTGTRTLSSSLNYWFWNLEKIVSTTLSRDYLANVLEAFILLRLHLVRNSTVVNFTSPFSDTYWFMIAKKKCSVSSHFLLCKLL